MECSEKEPCKEEKEEIKEKGFRDKTSKESFLFCSIIDKNYKSSEKMQFHNQLRTEI